mgnify:CR=1 FL=1
MATAFSAFQTMVLETFKRTDKTTELKRAINETYKEMIACLNPRKQQDQIYRSTFANREEYPFPEAAIRIAHPVRLIDLTNNTNNSSSSHPLRFITKDEYDELEPNPNATTISGSRPHSYTIFKNSLLLTSIPDKAYRLEINITQEATPLVDGADQVIFPITWDETIKFGALARLYAIIERWDMAEVAQTAYRYGFAGSEGNIVGGLELFRKLQAEVSDAVQIVKPTYF